MSNMNPCFLLKNPEQTPLAGATRVGIAHRQREKAWRLPVQPLEAVLRDRMCRCVRQAPAQPPLGRGAERLPRVVHR
jgi:3-methyladenine DNA glycosylase Mpg